MPFRRFLCTTVAVLAACWVGFMSSRAQAQTITIPAFPVRPPNDHEKVAGTGLTISQSDCQANETWRFTLNVTGGLGTTLEVWVGQGSNDCTMSASRTGLAAICTRVAPPISVAGTVQTVDIRVQDIANVGSGLYGEQAVIPGTSALCSPTASTATPQPLTLFFMLFAVSGQAMPTFSLPWTQPTTSTGNPLTLDLLGPGPPTGVSAQGGSTFIKVNWTINPDIDVKGYRIFCDPPPGGVSDAAFDAPRVTDANVASCDAGAAVDASDAESADAEDAPSSAAPDAAACTTPDAGTPVICTGGGGAFFFPNTLPDPAVARRFQCGQVGGNTITTATIEGFGSFATTAITVAAFDQVQNLGKFSNVSCATTEPVNGFIDLYHQAGGTAGGGFCSMTSRPGGNHDHEFLYGSLVLGAFFAHRLRRRRAPN